LSQATVYGLRKSFIYEKEDFSRKISKMTNKFYFLGIKNICNIENTSERFTKKIIVNDYDNQVQIGRTFNM
jgi:hypothetical protein